MGLSASQARLLSITQRLSNNELESEIVSKNKMVLSARNTAASEKYISALESTKMEYISYNDTGIQEAVALSFNSLSSYTPLKNQYNLYNSQGQVLVSATDATNFAKSTDLYSFLDCYGLFDKGRDEDENAKLAYEAAMNNYTNVELPAYYAALEAYNNKTSTDWVNYYADKVAYEQKQEDEYQAALRAYEASPEYNKYLQDKALYDQAKMATNPYEAFKSAVGTSSSPESCYANALSNPTGGCYAHVLAYLINPGTTQEFTTSTGKKINVGSSDVSGSAISSSGRGDAMTAPREALQQKYRDSDEYIVKCDGDDDLSTDGQQNKLKEIIDAGNTPTEIQLLMSDYTVEKNSDDTFVTDDSGNIVYGIKSVYQKAIDMMYIIRNQTAECTAEVMKNLLINFTDGDMANVNFTEPTPPPAPEKDKTAFPDPEPVFSEVMPTKPEIPAYGEKIYDKPLAQWYTNLWYAMEGKEYSDQISSVYDKDATFDYYRVENSDRETTFDGAVASGVAKQSNGYYTVIDKELASDSNWLEFALNNGIVTMKQAALRTNGEITWAGIEFSSTSDIKEVEDSTLIAKAQAEYEQSIMAIQAEDKEYDAELKKLDTEHSALKAEVDSIKNVMSKNIEKSFNTFS